MTRAERVGHVLRDTRHKLYTYQQFEAIKKETAMAPGSPLTTVARRRGETATSDPADDGSSGGDVRMATEFVTAIKTSEIPTGGITAVDVRGMRVALANVAGTYYAFNDECTHEQCSLAELGELAGTTLTCTCHGSEFDVRTGKVLAPPATLPVKVYPVRVAGDAVQIEV
jgi:nitrite reductase/ring-hydroxylating ferredoxin subunit